MHGGFRILVNPPTMVHDIDVEGTRAERERLNARYRRQRELKAAVLLNVGLEPCRCWCEVERMLAEAKAQPVE